MTIEWDEPKRAATLSVRGLDFADAARVFDDDTLDIVDDRRDYGEERQISIGRLDEAFVVVVWTWRGTTRRVISMRSAKATERAMYGRRMG